MSSFTEAKFIKLLPKRSGRTLYITEKQFQYDIGYEGSGLCVKVPAGFQTDGPSIPPLLQKLLPLRNMIKSCAVHDMLREDYRFTKLEGDAIFLSAMQAEKTPFILRELAFLLVRLNNSRKRHNEI